MTPQSWHETLTNVPGPSWHAACTSLGRAWPARFMDYHSPPVFRGSDGEARRVGIEIELAGLQVDEVAHLVARVLGGHVELGDVPTVAHVEDTGLGRFRVELDARALQERTWSERLEGIGVDAAPIEDAVLSIAQQLVPVEIVTPPIAIDALGELDPLWTAVREAGALGTDAAARYAFGLHLNPDVPVPLTAANILRHLQAYLLLEDWIAEVEHVNWTRRVTPYIRPFAEPYRRTVLERGYAPGLDRLIADYLSHSPTRNRPLDLLPLFTYLRPDCLEGREVHGVELVNPRPTFHYRLPNCEIDHPGWTPAVSWNRWVRVERLAAQPERLAKMAEAYGQLRDLPLRLQRGDWARQVRERWVGREASR